MTKYVYITIIIDDSSTILFFVLFPYILCVENQGLTHSQILIRCKVVIYEYMLNDEYQTTKCLS